MPTSMADALFTKTQQRVMAFLFGQPERSFYASELIRLTHAGSGAVQRELARLVSSGLVAVTLIGRQKHYQANASSPVFEELHSIVVKTVAVTDPIREALEPIREAIERALVYGSVAKGGDTASSDIDLLVVTDGIALEDLYSTLAPIERRLDRRINVTVYTPEEFQYRKESRGSFLDRVLDGEHVLLIGSEDDTRAPGEPGQNWESQAGTPD